MGPARSARRIQPGGCGRPGRARGSPRSGPPPGRRRGLRRAHFFRGGAPRPAPVRPGRVRGRRWLAASGPRALQRPPAPTQPLTPGAAGSVLAPSLPAGRDGAPRPRRRRASGRTVLSPPRPRCAARAGIRPSYNGRSRSAERSATHPTRLETRTKESYARASQRVSSSPHGAMKVKAGFSSAQVGSPRPGGGRTTGPPGPPPSGGGGWSKSACESTRKMVNYAWAGRSQGKPWWRPAAVLTCKSVVRPGHRGERLIEPSSSWFPPKFPSG